MDETGLLLQPAAHRCAFHPSYSYLAVRVVDCPKPRLVTSAPHHQEDARCRRCACPGLQTILHVVFVSPRKLSTPLEVLLENSLGQGILLERPSLRCMMTRPTHIVSDVTMAT